MECDEKSDCCSCVTTTLEICLECSIAELVNFGIWGGTPVYKSYTKRREPTPKYGSQQMISNPLYKLGLGPRKTPKINKKQISTLHFYKIKFLLFINPSIPLFPNDPHDCCTVPSGFPSPFYESNFTRSPFTVPNITHCILNKFRATLHSRLAILQCKRRLSILPPALLHMKHQLT